MTESPLDDYLRLLTRSQRRQILEALLDDPETAVRIEECLSADSTASYGECKPHLDMLERAGVIERGEAERTVVRGEEFDQIEPLVRALTEVKDSHDFAWDRPQRKTGRAGSRPRQP